MPYNFAAESFRTKKHRNRFSSKEVPFLRKTDPLRFGAYFGGLWATYAVHLKLIGKLVGDFLLVIIVLFR